MVKPLPSLMRTYESFLFFVLQIVLHQLVNILKQTEKVVATLTDVELPEWKRRQQLACIGSQADTSLDHLDKWLELICSAHLCMSKRICFSSLTFYTQHLCLFYSVCRFSTVVEVLLGVCEQLKKLQDQNSKYSSTDPAFCLPTSIPETEKFGLSLLIKLVTKWVTLFFFFTYIDTHTDAPTVWIVTRSVVVWHCSALVVEKQPVMQKFPPRPLILKTGVQFSITVR